MKFLLLHIKYAERKPAINVNQLILCHTGGKNYNLLLDVVYV
jgi:hypothetical protein